MPRKGSRTRVARGVYDDGTGRSLVVRDPQTGRPKEFRHPKNTPIHIMRREAERWLKSRRASRQVRTIRGTLNASIDRWEQLEQHLASWKERRAELRAWSKLYGDWKLYAIESDDVRKAISHWSVAGVSPKTIRNRLWTLKHLYRIILGPDAITPCDHVEPPAVPRKVINPTPASTILTVYTNLLAFETSGRLRDAKTRARFMVRAASGRRPVEIMRAQPDDVDLARRIWRVRDAKGGWSEGLYLHDELLEAWTLFVESDAWGEFDTGSMAEVLRAAGWPSERDQRGKYTSRPYNLRHSVGIALSESGADFADVAGYLGHRDVRTTRQSYVPVLNSRMERAGKLLEKRIGWSVPSPVPSSHATDRSKLLHNKARPEKGSTGRNRS